MIISMDTETGGVDFAHGAMPFLVTWCEPGQAPCFVEWDVDPVTRQPEVPQEDVAHITELLDAADLVYMQNSKFDARALATVGIKLPWPKVRDTLIAGHLLASNHPHNLTAMCVEYLGVDIEKHESLVKEVTRACRQVAKRDYPKWKLADEGVFGMPSVKASSKRDDDKPWKNDMWLPRVLAKELGRVNTFRLGFLPEIPNKNWLDACSKYACADSEYTLYLGLEMERLVRERGLWKIYEHRLHLMRVDCDMETCGITARGDYTESTAAEYRLHVAEAEAAMCEIAAEFGHDLELADGAALNDNMRDFFYGATKKACTQCKYVKRVKHWNGESDADHVYCPKCSGRKRDPRQVALVTSGRTNLDLPVVANQKTGNASLDKAAMENYIQTLDDGPVLDFIELLADKRVYDTALSYIDAYRRYWVPVSGHRGYYRIHCSINPCGTDHLRQSSNSPNMQNVSGESKELSNRACFGPLPNREWWRMDYRSIERRIPPFECGEPKMVEVFEHPDKSPYWGTLYYLTASVLYPDEFWPLAEFSPDDPRGFKKRHPRLYKQAKFFDLAKQYGCGRRKGDLLAQVENSFDRVDSEFPKLAALQAKYLRDAERDGYVQTLPNRKVDPERGYPILASRTDDGRVLSTTPFNYHVSGTACQVKNDGMILCADKCREWRADGFDTWLVLEVHDELLFDFPRGATMEENLPRATELRRLMESVGGDLVPAIPTPVSMEYCTESWAEGVSV